MGNACWFYGEKMESEKGFRDGIGRISAPKMRPIGACGISGIFLNFVLSVNKVYAYENYYGSEGWGGDGGVGL